MKILVFLLSLSIYMAVPVFSRDKGWVPIPKSADSPLGKSVKRTKKKPAQPVTVYENQPVMTESEISSFILLLPQFRNWAKQNGEEAHPIVSSNGKPDFVYSPKAAQWVKQHNFKTERFFCIMGKIAAGMVIVEEGNDFSGTRPIDMPEILPSELELVRKHMEELHNVSRNF